MWKSKGTRISYDQGAALGWVSRQILLLPSWASRGLPLGTRLQAQDMSGQGLLWGQVSLPPSGIPWPASATAPTHYPHDLTVCSWIQYLGKEKRNKEKPRTWPWDSQCHRLLLPPELRSSVQSICKGSILCFFYSRILLCFSWKLFARLYFSTQVYQK